MTPLVTALSRARLATRESSTALALSPFDRMAVAKVNVDESQAIAAKYGIRGIPTLMLFKNGTLVGTKVGAVSKGQLTAFLDSNL